MKHIKLLLIINAILIISSCENDKKDTKDKNITDITVPTDTQEVANIKDTTNITVEIDSINSKKEKLEQDSIKKEEVVKGNMLKVVINGKIYLKKHKNDTKVIRGNSNTHYYNEEIDYYYDIITGKTVYDYGKHGISIPEK